MRNLEFRTRFIDLGDDVNRSMPGYVVQRVTDVLNDVGKSVRGSRILILGVAYKPNVGDIRESPGVVVAEQLVQLGADVSYVDPHVASLTLQSGAALPRVNLSAAVLTESDLAVITTRHDGIDWDLVRSNSRRVLDTRGVRVESGRADWHTL
jgi:UDP-N-acetyl-D-glucosamine dehydrogenase